MIYQKHHDYEHQVWREEVKQRDNYQCRKCGSKSNIQAHHITAYKDKKRARYVSKNGISLCRKCHRQFHNVYGYSGNAQNLREFLRKSFKGKRK